MEQTARTTGTASSPSKRTPLAERQPRARQKSNVSRASAGSKAPTPSRIPHHESVYPEGNLSVITRSAAPSARPINERVIAIAEDDFDINKRDSQISTTSTVSTGKGKRKTHIGPWQLGRTLGKGATGRVRLAKHSFTGQTAAIKIVSKKSAAMVQSASMRQMDNDTAVSSNISGARTMPFGIEREIVIMKLIEHPNVISLYDIWENRGELYLVLEYVEGGELFDYVMRNSALPEGEAVRLLRQLIAGLAYCHRFNICHRDLKPENILLDRDHNIKIADFGMAALQPSGQYLTTSCGSPHYAAPEIIAGRQYRGDKADIWSVGIILYAMLNGYLPFDGGDLHSTLALVKKGEYYLSPNLSTEAADLIQRILQKRPEKRISMNEIWRHPLLRKYERIHSSLAAPAKLAGPPSPLTAADCGPRRIKASNIDRELLRNLQILWHGLGEAEVVKRLTSEEPNHEKLFYWALIKFREEQLENYQGDLLQHSASDYHHLKPAALRISKSTTRSALHHRRTSQFSIVSDDSIVRAAYYKNPGIATSKTTQGSYDPYRASRTPVARPQRKGTSVIVRRPQSRASTQGRSGDRSMSQEKSVSIIPNLPSLPSQDVQRIVPQIRATYSTVSSYSSLASSHRHRAFRKSTSYRRNVSFRHHRQYSSRTTQSSKYRESRGSLSRPGTQDSNQPFSDSRSTPSLPTPHHVKQPRRPASDLDLPGPRPSNVPWRDETRHVSAELSKICEEAFNRSSVSYASDTSHQFPVDSPATTTSIPESLLPRFGKGKSVLVTPALRDLLEHRSRIIESWGRSDSKTLADIVGTLDRHIFQEQQRANANAGFRAASDPINDKYRDSRDVPILHTMHEPKHYGSEKRAASDPIKYHQRTIRVVTPDPASPMARTGAQPSKATPINSLKGGPIDVDRREYDKRLLTGQFLEPIFEDPTRSSNKQVIPETKKWSWRGKKTASSSEDVPPTPPRKDTPKQKDWKPNPEVTINPSGAKHEPVNFDETEAKKRTWFQKVFMKRRKDEDIFVDGNLKVLLESVEEEEDSMQELSNQTRRTSTRKGNRLPSSVEEVANPSSNSRSEASQNWFAKFLHLKPAARVLVMQASKAQSRKEIVKILREWRKFGVRDVAVEKHPSGDIVRARVDATNYLRIRPVQFFASVYTVLERGKLANLSIIKFTQQKGAASSFYKVVDTVESVFKEADLLVPDLMKRKMILKSAKRAGL